MSEITTCDIALSQRETVTELYRKYGNVDSAHSFDSIFIWKDDMDLRIHLDSSFYAVRDCTMRNTWFFPVGKSEAKRRFIKQLQKEPELQFSYATKSDIEFLNYHFPDEFEIWEEPSGSEYIMSRDTLENLSGGAFSKTRGYIRKILMNHEMRTAAIRDIPLSDILYVICLWETYKREYGTIIDENATLNALTCMDELSVEGVVLFMDGAPCAVAAGFYLRDDTVDCCIQKTTSGMQGLTYYLRQEFARSFPPEVKFFNWEEDLGLEGLRQAKTLMHPCGMIDMFTGRLK